MKLSEFINRLQNLEDKGHKDVVVTVASSKGRQIVEDVNYVAVENHGDNVERIVITLHED